MKCLATLLLAISFTGCHLSKSKAKEIELRPDTILTVYQTVRNGFLEGSVDTSLFIKWPRSTSQEEIGKASYFDGTEDIRLIETLERYILVYGSSVYYRNIREGKWTLWHARNSYFSPPNPSIASYFRDWFIEHSQTDFDYIPHGTVTEPNEKVPFEQISFPKEHSEKRITLGTRTNWTIPYKFDSAESKTNTIYFATEDSTLPRYLAFRGASGHFGSWFFDPKATTEKNAAEQGAAANP